jgi:lipopolysaccharide export LptBFGC system permease protein LptF
LAVLIAVLVTFGVLNRNSELIAMKATGISLYRLVVPIVSIAAILSVSLFLFDEFYLPQANRRQEALRSTIKGRPPQTFLHPEQKWIFGQPHPGEPGRIFYYQFFVTNSRISPSSSSTPPPSPSRGAFLRRASSGMGMPGPGASRMDGNAISKGPT